MRSSHSNTLQLQVCADQMTAMRLDNHVCISREYKKDERTVMLALQKSEKERLLGLGSSSVFYPVMFTSEVEQGQIVVPDEIRGSLSLPLGKVISCDLKELNAKSVTDLDEITFELLDFDNGTPQVATTDPHQLAEIIKAAFRLYPSSFPLAKDQVIMVPLHDGRLKLRVSGIFFAADDHSHARQFGYLTSATNIQFINTCAHKVNLRGVDVSHAFDMPPIESMPLDFVDNGIGGFKKEISQLIRSVFYSRAVKRSFLDAYGVKKHAKGILFYGPPGTGKTLIASEISKLFTREPLIVIEGPQLKNSYYGATQQNLAGLFDVARKNPNKLYVYLFDELDALFGVRGSDNSVSMSNNNDLVNRFCSILDGHDSPENIIVIGTTNRKELIDPALLRAGRLDTQIYLGLPNEADRLEILQVHTRGMEKTLSSDVDLNVIAANSVNYSGAELARLVRVAKGYAMEKNFIAKNNMLLFRPDIQSIEQAEKITQAFFLRALREVKPLFGIDELCQRRSENDFIMYDDRLHSVIDNSNQCIEMLKCRGNINQLNFLICGQSGTGKTSMANYLARQSGFPYVQLMTANKLLSYDLPRQLAYIDEVFARAQQSSESSVIILENLEDLIEATPDFHGYNNKLRLKFNEMLKYSNAHDNKILVIATTDNSSFLQRIGLANHFSEFAELQPVHFDCRDTIKVASIIGLLAEQLGVAIVNDLDEKNDVMIDISIKDLIYHLNKFTPTDAPVSLSKFIYQLPARFHSLREDQSWYATEQADVKQLRMFGK